MGEEKMSDNFLEVIKDGQKLLLMSRSEETGAEGDQSEAV